MNKNSIIDFIFEIGTLRNMHRMHTQVLPNSNDTIASHSFRTAIIAYFLADLEKANKDRALKMALFHDIPETRTGDANFVHQFYVDANNGKAHSDQINNLPSENEMKLLFDDYEERKSPESIIAKDADILDQLFLEKEILNEKSHDFSKWHEFSRKKLRTNSAKNLAKALLDRNPMQWFYNFDEGLRRNIKK